jgi:hypothetical protein
MWEQYSQFNNSLQTGIGQMSGFASQFGSMGNSISNMDNSLAQQIIANSSSSSS